MRTDQNVNIAEGAGPHFFGAGLNSGEDFRQRLEAVDQFEDMAALAFEPGVGAEADGLKLAFLAKQGFMRKEAAAQQQAPGERDEREAENGGGEDEQVAERPPGGGAEESNVTRGTKADLKAFDLAPEAAEVDDADAGDAELGAGRIVGDGIRIVGALAEDGLEGLIAGAEEEYVGVVLASLGDDGAIEGQTDWLV